MYNVRIYLVEAGDRCNAVQGGVVSSKSSTERVAIT